MNTNEQWKKLMLLVMKFFELQNELTNLRIEEMNEWSHHQSNAMRALPKR